MLDIETVTRNATARTFRFISASPEALREHADRLEQAAKDSVRGEAVQCELSPGVVLVYKPDRARSSGFPPVPNGCYTDGNKAGFTDEVAQSTETTC